MFDTILHNGQFAGELYRCHCPYLSLLCDPMQIVLGRSSLTCDWSLMFVPSSLCSLSTQNTHILYACRFLVNSVASQIGNNLIHAETNLIPLCPLCSSSWWIQIFLLLARWTGTACPILLLSSSTNDRTNIHSHRHKTDEGKELRHGPNPCVGLSNVPSRWKRRAHEISPAWRPRSEEVFQPDLSDA